MPHVLNKMLGSMPFLKYRQPVARLMNQILVAVDGSKHSEKIAEEAVTVAKSMGAKILLLYVCPKSLDVPEEFREFARAEDVDLSQYYSMVSDEILLKIGTRIKGKGIEFEGISGFGRASDQILEVAKARGVSMIVVGMHGLHAVRDIKLLGTTARRVIEQSPVPVVVVP